VAIEPVIPTRIGTAAKTRLVEGGRSDNTARGSITINDKPVRSRAGDSDGALWDDAPPPAEYDGPPLDYDPDSDPIPF
jgi:hypothetical protein